MNVVTVSEAVVKAMLNDIRFTKLFTELATAKKNIDDIINGRCDRCSSQHPTLIRNEIKRAQRALMTASTTKQKQLKNLLKVKHLRFVRCVAGKCQITTI